MKVSQLLKDLAVVKEQHDVTVTGLCSDSREIKPGNCFFALKGDHQDGRNYIPKALAAGATVVVVDQETPYPNAITIPKLTQHLGEIAARFYDHPSEKMTVIGVTGTNGKTSVTQYIAKALQLTTQKCSVIGTLGYGFPDELQPSSHTTGNPIILQRQLSELYAQGARVVAMEVSSHALEQQRTNSIAFDIAIFTNLTRDHLDYHGTMENYGAAKRKLFATPNLKYAIINTDDAFGAQLAKDLQNKLTVYGYNLQTNELSLPSIQAHHINLNSKGSIAKIASPWGAGQLRTKLLGRFNISNLLAVLTVLQLLNISLDDSLELLSQLTNAPGRMDVYGGGKLPLVVVDYSHTPDALMQALVLLRDYVHGNLWCVFGCGGDRDPGKRPLMGQIAERYSDQLVITDDNPRTEDPGKIVADIMSGLVCPWAVEVQHDRGAAIAHVISCAQPGDVILVAGKGHEPYQIIGTDKFPFKDGEHVQTQLRLRQKTA